MKRDSDGVRPSSGAATWHCAGHWRNRERLLVERCCGRGRPHSERWLFRQALSVFSHPFRVEKICLMFTGGIARGLAQPPANIFHSYAVIRGTPSIPHCPRKCRTTSLSAWISGSKELFHLTASDCKTAGNTFPPRVCRTILSTHHQRRFPSSHFCHPMNRAWRLPSRRVATTLAVAESSLG